MLRLKAESLRLAEKIVPIKERWYGGELLSWDYSGRQEVM